MKNVLKTSLILALISLVSVTFGQELLESKSRAIYDDFANDWEHQNTFDYSYNDECLIMDWINTGTPNTIGGNIGGAIENFSYNMEYQLTEGYFAYMLNGAITDTIYKYTYLFDLGELVSKTRYTSPFETEDIDKQENYTYDVNGNLIEMVYTNWNNFIEEWENLTRDTYTYEGTILTGVIHEEWDDDIENWDPVEREEVEYGIEGAVSLITYFDWNNFNDEWDLDRRDLHTYENDLLLEVVNEFYIWQDDLWVPSERYLYTWIECSPASRLFEITSEQEVVMYPNPASSRINLKFGNSMTAQSYRILNLKGEIVQTDRLFKEPEEIDISNLSAGMYILELLIDNNRTRKTLEVE